MASMTVTAGQSPAWHTLDSATVLALLGSREAGLAETERIVRRARFGPNQVRTREPKRWPAELAESLAEPLQLLLIAVAVLSAVFGELADALVIAAVIATVALLETATEMRAARAIDALRTMTAPTARLRTAAGVAQVPAADLVPGDVISVEAGDVVPADARVLTARGLRADESTLTGEAQPVGKSDIAVPPPAELAERSSVVFAGTAVVAGEATAVVVATGPASELGRLGGLVADAKEPPTALQRALSHLARVVLILAVAASVLVPVVGLLAGQPWREMILSGLTVAFATIPEELPILVVVLLAVGGRQLAHRGALLRRLKAGETLGAVSVVTDKTGTLTENRLTLAGIDGDRAQVLAVAVATQPPAGAGREPMDEQLSAAANDAGVDPPGVEVAAFPFDPQHKMVSRAHLDEGALTLAVAGAPEQVLARCRIAHAAQANVVARVAQLAGQGMRVIAFARKDLQDVPNDRQTAETGLSYVGLAWFDDPLRDGVPQAAAALSLAGVQTMVVTGDHPATAAAVAAQAGLPAGHLIGSGEQLDAMSDTQLDERLVHGTVVARATPTAKHRIVTVLQRRGEVVAVTGDGANDAPARAAADVGVAMGARGATAASEAADVVLTVDRLEGLVLATRIAQRTRRIALESVLVGMGLSLVAMVFAAAGYIAPVAGAVLQEGIDVLVILNALRALGGAG